MLQAFFPNPTYLNQAGQQSKQLIFMRQAFVVAAFVNSHPCIKPSLYGREKLTFHLLSVLILTLYGFIDLSSYRLEEDLDVDQLKMLLHYVSQYWLALFYILLCCPLRIFSMSL